MVKKILIKIKYKFIYIVQNFLARYETLADFKGNLIH